jgi:hypothetical protein
MAIHVTYSPQAALPGQSLAYTWTGRVLTARLEPQGLEEIYDLSSLQPNDEVTGVEPETLPFSPLISARVDEDGDLHVTLLFWYEGEEPKNFEEVIDG